MEGFFYNELQYHPYPPLDFVYVKSMDGLGFLGKFAVPSIPLSDLSNLFFALGFYFSNTRTLHRGIEDVGNAAAFLLLGLSIEKSMDFSPN